MNLDHVVVTGGAGFIGSHLTERLLKEGHAVTVIDDFSTGRMDNLKGCASHGQLCIRSGKVSETPDLGRIVANSSAVYHLAAAVGVELVVRSPIQTISTNLRETEVILEACGRERVPVLLASTSEVYGKSQKEDFSEDDDLLIGPPHLGRWSYACSKLMDEFLALAFARERNLPVRIVRLFNTVGPRQTGRYGMVVPRFIDAAKSGNPLRVFGDGQQSRCFCSVRDTVEALVRLQRCQEAAGEIINVGSREEISIGDLAILVNRLLGGRSAIERVAYQEAYAPGFQDMLRRRPNTEKLSRLTGFLPMTSLETIIREAAECG